MFNFTPLAKELNDKIFVQHLQSGDYLLEAQTYEDAVLDELKTAGFVGDLYEQEVRDSIMHYTLEEVMEAALDGYGWPVELGLVEDIEDDR